MLDHVVEWYSNDPDLATELHDEFLSYAERLPAINIEKNGDGEYPVDVYDAFLQFQNRLEQRVACFLYSEGGSFEELHALAKDSDLPYSDAWMFVTLFSCTCTFLFFADMVKQAQVNMNFRFSTTLGLNPRCSI